MRIFNLNFAAILFAIFALTSCQKESMSEMTQTTPTATTSEIAANKERNLPAEGINIVFDEVQTQASAAKFKQGAQARNKGYKEIDCGFDYDGCTKGQGNSLDYRIYPDNVDALGAPFDGEDEYFFLEVPSTPEAIVTYDIALTDMTVDLDLFVFALNSQYQIVDTKGMSIKGGSADEHLSLTGLNPGIYVVVVDAYISSIAGHYSLAMNCSAVSANPPSISLIDVNKVVFGANGQQLGTYQQMTPTTWKEISADPNGNNFDFVEVGRDEWSVYLTDESRGVNIQLDLHRKIVRYSDAQSPIRDQFEILDSNNKMNGYLTSAVAFGDGQFDTGYYKQVETSENWKEILAVNNRVVNFTETHRDEWSVYLRDDSRGVNIQLDMHRMKVVYSDDQGNRFDLYEINKAE